MTTVGYAFHKYLSTTLASYRISILSLTFFLRESEFHMSGSLDLKEEDWGFLEVRVFMKNKKLKRDCLCTATSHTSSPKSL
jgi:hypothetical protein